MKKCSAPIGVVEDETKFDYEVCGKEAVCKLGHWYVCEEHREFWLDRYPFWKAKPIKGDN